MHLNRPLTFTHLTQAAIYAQLPRALKDLPDSKAYRTSLSGEGQAPKPATKPATRVKRKSSPSSPVSPPFTLAHTRNTRARTHARTHSLTTQRQPYRLRLRSEFVGGLLLQPKRPWTCGAGPLMPMQRGLTCTTGSRVASPLTSAPSTPIARLCLSISSTSAVKCSLPPSCLLRLPNELK
jgi:hypothetical protein